MMSKKVFALYHNFATQEIKITSEKHWINAFNKVCTQAEFPNDVDVYVWNDNIYLSQSRAALVKRAEKIKIEWLQNLYDSITTICNLKV